jgi:hypothetical protein
MRSDFADFSPSRNWSSLAAHRAKERDVRVPIRLHPGGVASSPAVRLHRWVCTGALPACGPPRLRSGRVGYRNAPFCHPAAFRNGRRCRRQLVDQGMSNLSIVNWRPSQKRNARLIDAISAPSRPHSSFVGSRCCCRAETSRSRAAVKSAMTISFRSSAKSPRVRANHGVSVNVVLPPNHWFGAKPCRAEFRAHRRGRAINPSR